MNGLCFQKLSAGYNGRALIRELDLQVAPGEILALVGPNGAGKSTLLKTAAGLLEPVSGQVLADGKELKKLKGAERAKALSVMLTERQHTEYMTCQQMVSIGCYHSTGIFGRLGEEEQAAVAEAMRLTGTSDLAEKEFVCLSDGQQQRVLLARAIVARPRILILDEPTSFLDIGYKLEFLDVLRQLAQQHGMAVLMSMHEMELARRTAHRVLCISRENRVDRIGPPDEVLTPGYIEQMFGLQAGKYREYYGNERT